MAKRNQEVCREFDLLFNKVMGEDKEFFNYFVSYTLGLMKNKMDEFDMRLIRNTYEIMKKGSDDVKEIKRGDYSSIDREDSEVEVSECCYTDYNALQLVQGSILSGPPDPIPYCENCRNRCETIWITKEELEKFQETGEKVKR
jgi:hypothetical protein